MDSWAPVLTETWENPRQNMRLPGCRLGGERGQMSLACPVWPLGVPGSQSDTPGVSLHSPLFLLPCLPREGSAGSPEIHRLVPGPLAANREGLCPWSHCKSSLSLSHTHAAARCSAAAHGINDTGQVVLDWQLIPASIAWQRGKGHDSWNQLCQADSLE